MRVLRRIGPDNMLFAYSPRLAARPDMVAGELDEKTGVFKQDEVIIESNPPIVAPKKVEKVVAEPVKEEPVAAPVPSAPAPVASKI